MIVSRSESEKNPWERIQSESEKNLWADVYGYCYDQDGNIIHPGKNRDSLLERMKYMIIEDSEPINQYTEIKHRIYTLYKTELACLFSKVEVTEHTWAEDVLQLMKEVFDTLAAAESEDNEADKLDLICFAETQFHVALDLIRIRLIDYNIRLFKTYRKELNSFNIGGATIKVGNQTVGLVEWCKEKEDLELDGYKKERKRILKQFEKNYMISDDYEESTVLDQYLQTAEQIVEQYEENYASVVSRGFRDSFSNRVGDVVLSRVIPLIVFLWTLYLFLH